MIIKEISENKHTLLQNNIDCDVIFNRFDLRYDDYLLFQVEDKYIPAVIKNNVLKIGVYNRDIKKENFNLLCDYIFENYKNIEFIEIENALFSHPDLMPDFLYYITNESLDDKNQKWLQNAGNTALSVQEALGKYNIVSTEKPAKDDKTTEENLTPDDPDYKPRIRNMDIVQFRINDKTEAMLLVSITGENVVFEHITSNHNHTKTHDIELVLAIEAILFFIKKGIKNFYLNGTATELKRRLNANMTKVYSGKIWRKNKLYQLSNHILSFKNETAKKLGKIVGKITKNKDFTQLIQNKTSDNYILDKKDVWFDFYETKEDSGFNSFEYFNHETSKNYINETMKHLPFKNGNNFMDIGCGTGYMMYKMQPFFKNIYGIELDKKWIEIAEENFKKLDITNYEILNKNINEVPSEFFDKAEVFYLFNPFVGETMKSLTDKLALSFARKKRKGYIIYINALSRQFFDDKKCFKVYKEFEFNHRKHVIYRTS